MNIRWIERDGVKVLQQQGNWVKESNGSYVYTFSEEYTDVPTVQEPRKAREFWIIESSDKNNLVVYENPPTIISNAWKLLHVREVLPDDHR